MLDDGTGSRDRVPYLWIIGTISWVGIGNTQTTGQLETPFACGFLLDSFHGLEGIAGTFSEIFTHHPGGVTYWKRPVCHLVGTGFLPDREKNFFE